MEDKWVIDLEAKYDDDEKGEWDAGDNIFKAYISEESVDLLEDLIKTIHLDSDFNMTICKTRGPKDYTKKKRD